MLVYPSGCAGALLVGAAELVPYCGMSTLTDWLALA